MYGPPVECSFQGNRVAVHPRRHDKGRNSTLSEHRAPSHRSYAEWSPERLTRWASTVGPQTGDVFAAVLKRRRHPEQAYRSALGIIRLRKQYGQDRLEQACRRALAINSPSYRTISSMLKTGTDSSPLPIEPQPQIVIESHENLRGPSYYH